MVSGERRWRLRTERILLPRWVLVAQYLGFFVLAVLVGAQGIIAFREAAPPNYEPVWCFALALGSLVAAFACWWLPPRIGDALEKWAAVWVSGWLAALLSAVIVSSGHHSASWFYVLLVCCSPVGRVIQLFGRAGRDASGGEPDDVAPGGSGE